jgi:hypothetical protein
VITLVADLDGPAADEIDRIKESLGGNALPLLAVFPGRDPYRPQVMMGWYTKSGLIRELHRAGPSQEKTLVSSTARTNEKPR